MIWTKKKILSIGIAVAAAVFMLFVTSGYTLADTDELEQIRHEIKARNAKWHADETSVSR
jgi:HAMP domain-containing protein